MAFIDIADCPGITRKIFLRVPLLTIAAYGAAKDGSRKDGIIKAALLHSRLRRKKSGYNDNGPDPGLSMLASSFAGR